MSDSPRFQIEPLNTAKHRREAFDCGVAALNDYLKTQARKDMEAGVTVCCVAVPESDPGCIAGFYTLSSATVLRAELPDPTLLNGNRMFLPMKKAVEWLKPSAP